MYLLEESKKGRSGTGKSFLPARWLQPVARLAITALAVWASTCIKVQYIWPVTRMKPSAGKKRKSTSKCACVACAANKRKCSGERPCGRCARLNIPCVDKLDKRSRAYKEKMARENTSIISVVQPTGKFRRKIPSKGAKAVASLLEGGPEELPVAPETHKAAPKSQASIVSRIPSIELDQLEGAAALFTLATDRIS